MSRVYTVSCQATLASPQTLPALLIAGVPALAAPSPRIEILNAHVTLPGSLADTQIELYFAQILAIGSVEEATELAEPGPHDPLDAPARSSWYSLLPSMPELEDANFGFGAYPGRPGWHFEPTGRETIFCYWDGEESIESANGIGLVLNTLYPSPDGLLLSISIDFQEG